MRIDNLQGSHSCSLSVIMKAWKQPRILRYWAEFQTLSLLEYKVKIWRKVAPILVTSNTKAVSDGVGLVSDNFNSFICTASFLGWQWLLSFARGAHIWCWHWCIFLRSDCSWIPCSFSSLWLSRHLLVRVRWLFWYFSPFLPLTLLLFSNSVFQWHKYEPRQTNEVFFPVLSQDELWGLWNS